MCINVTNRTLTELNLFNGEVELWCVFIGWGLAENIKRIERVIRFAFQMNFWCLYPQFVNLKFAREESLQLVFEFYFLRRDYRHRLACFGYFDAADGDISEDAAFDVANIYRVALFQPIFQF